MERSLTTTSIVCVIEAVEIASRHYADEEWVSANWFDSIKHIDDMLGDFESVLNDIRVDNFQRFLLELNLVFKDVFGHESGEYLKHPRWKFAQEYAAKCLPALRLLEVEVRLNELTQRKQ